MLARAAVRRLRCSNALPAARNVDGVGMGRLLRRVLSRRVCVADGHLSRGDVAAALQRSTRERGEPPHRSLSDLAPGEVYPAGRVAPAAGGLLHHRFTLTAGRSPRRSTFCCTFSRVAPGGCYPPPCSVEPGRSSAIRLRGSTRPSCRPIPGSTLAQRCWARAASRLGARSCLRPAPQPKRVA